MSYTLLSQTEPKARKEHRCIWCGEKILVGEQHTHERSIYDGNFQNHRWHGECFKSSREQFSEWDDCEFEPHQNERGQRESVARA